MRNAISCHDLRSLHARSARRVSSYLALVVAPTEPTMGDVQRIFYYHVPSAWVAGLCFLRQLPGVGRVPLEAQCRKRRVWPQHRPRWASCSAAVLLITGPLWARPVWGIWWTWDARLTTTLILWLIYVSYLVLRRFAAGGQTQVLAAAFAIFGFVDVPIVYFSIRWFRTQHPSPVIGGGPDSGLALRCCTSS